MPTKRRTTHIILGDDLHQEIEQRAQELGQSTSEYIRRALRVHLGYFPVLGRRVSVEGVQSDPVALANLMGEHQK